MDFDNNHKFWSTQPVPQTGKDLSGDGPIDAPKTVDDVPQEPYPIASVFEWWTPNVENEDDMKKIYVLLRDNYVEDDGCMFRFNYSLEFLKWALAPPGYHKEWHVSVRKKSDKTVLGFISGIPVMTKMVDEKKLICEINFLCVKKTLRERRLAPILIKEVTRRVNLQNIWQAIYTAGKELPTPFCTANYFHRAIDAEKLISVGFSRMPPRFNSFAKPMQMVKRSYALPEKTYMKRLREMSEKDVPEVTRLLNEKQEGYKVAPNFSEEDIRHWILPREGVTYSYVDESAHDPEKIENFFSFYSLPSTIIGNSKYKLLNAAYVYYYAHTTCPIIHLMNDLLIKVRDNKFDVCNCVDVIENGQVVEELKFAPGDGSLHYYFYNWRFPHIEAKECMLVML